MTMQRRYEMGSGGSCICPNCGAKIPHRRGIPCQEERCPGCDCSWKARITIACSRKNRQGSGGKARAHSKGGLPEQSTRGTMAIAYDIDT
jgi:hypothetical protein